MAERGTTPGTTWPTAAAALARRCTRRARIGAALPQVAGGLLAGALPALLCRIVPSLAGAQPLGPWFITAGGLIGFVVGLRRARGVQPVPVADAAWALDRIGGAGERGLTAATVEGPRGAEAAWAAPTLAAPPSIRLLPPRGLALLVGAALVAAIALLAKPAATLEDAAATAAGSGSAAGARNVVASPAEAAAAAERAAVDTEAVGSQAEAVAEALGLPKDEPVDPARLAERLADPERREAAQDAARGSPLAAALDGGTNEAERFARAMNASLAPDARAERRRREAVALRALEPRAAVPAHRRAVVDRYYELEGDR